MKKSTFRISLVAAAFLMMFCFAFTPATEQPLKITICHMPPGNQDNCQQITISLEAFDTHIEHHEDALVCNNVSEHEFYKLLASRSGMKLVTTFE